MNGLPRILVLHGDNIGDRNQAESLAKLMGWPYLMEKLHPPRRPRMPKVAGPVPDAVIVVTAIGMDIALKMNQQLNRPMKIIKMGHAEKVESADLNIVTGRGWKPPRGTIVYQHLPFSMVDADQMDRAISDFPDLQHLPQPRIAALIGGRNRYFQWGPEIARALGNRLNAAAAAVSGSLLLTTSYRTGDECSDALLAEIKVPHAFYRWGKDSQPNPLMAYLAYADRIVVTIESVAMVADALNSGKPVSVYRLQPKRFELLKTIAEWFIPVSQRTAVIRTLLKSGEISWFDDAAVQPKIDYRGRYSAAVDAARKLVVEENPARPQLG